MAPTALCLRNSPKNHIGQAQRLFPFPGPPVSRQIARRNSNTGITKDNRRSLPLPPISVFHHLSQSWSSLCIIIYKAMLERQKKRLLGNPTGHLLTRPFSYSFTDCPFGKPIPPRLSSLQVSWSIHRYALLRDPSTSLCLRSLVRLVDRSRHARNRRQRDGSLSRGARGRGRLGRFRRRARGHRRRGSLWWDVSLLWRRVRK